MTYRQLLVFLMLLLFLPGCATDLVANYGVTAPVARGAFFEYPYLLDQPTGIAISRQGRVFINFPRWHGDPRQSVAEVLSDGAYRPFPDDEWNSWGIAEAKHPEAHFICVQSVIVDGDDFLWIVDAASPSFKGVIPGGAKLVKINLDNGKVERVIPFQPDILPKHGYLNDLRVDTRHNFAYITDSGSGALIVIDLATGKMRRRLAGHQSTKAETGYVPIIGGREFRDNDGKVPQIHADGIALDTRNEYLYYHALTATTLYRINTEYLRDAGITESALAEKVEKVAETGAVDGMEMGADDSLFFTALEGNAIKRYQSNGTMTTIVRDQNIHWPDSIAISPDKYLYFTDSQINLAPRFNKGTDIRISPYSFYKIWLTPF